MSLPPAAVQRSFPSCSLGFSRRPLALLSALLALVAARPALAQFPPAPTGGVRVFRLTHQFPGGTAEQGDQRDRIARRFAQELEKRTGGVLRVEIFPASKMMKPAEEPAALQKGAVEMAILPVNNAFSLMPELQVSLLPGLIRSYEQAFRWKTQPIGASVTSILREKGLVLLTWNWLGAGAVSVGRPIMLPADVSETRARGAGKSVDALLAAAGARTVDMPSSQIASAFRERKVDVAFTTASSLLSFKLQDFCRAVTTPRRGALAYFLVPLFISQATFDSLTPDQQKIVRDIGQSLEPFALELARADDELLAETYLRANAVVTDLDDDQFAQWQALARVVAWREFERNVPRGPELLKQALAVP